MAKNLDWRTERSPTAAGLRRRLPIDISLAESLLSMKGGYIEPSLAALVVGLYSSSIRSELL